MAVPKKQSPFELSTATNRFFRFYIVMLLLAVAVFVRVCYIIFMQHDYWESVQQHNMAKVDTIRAQRGSILSDEGLYLASYLPTYEITLDFKVIDKNEKQRARYQKELDSAFVANVDSFALGLSEILGKTPAYHKNYLVEAHAKHLQSCKLGKQRMSFAQRQKVRELPYFKNRRQNRFSYREEIYDGRTYPHGKLALRTIGELYAAKRQARSGIELGMNDFLMGEDGLTRSIKVGKNHIDSIIKPSINGADVYTTLNIDMQDLCDQVLRDQLRKDNPIWGSCLVMEVATGDIKAMVNLERKSNGNYEEGINRIVSNQLEPGSVFKAVSALVALNDNRININSGYNLTGGIRIFGNRQMREHNYLTRGGYSGYHTLPFILGYSSNVGISSLVHDSYKNDPKAFVDGIRRTGILDPFDIKIPGTAPGHVNHPDSSRWSKTSLPWLSIGYECMIPPLSTVAFYNGVANGGKMMRPRLVTKAIRGEEVVYDNPVSVQRERMASPEAIEQLQRCLAYVVDSGLGNKASSEYFTSAGKTGTAQVWERSGNTNRKLVSFVGYFPADKPRYTMMVTMEGYGLPGGATNCAPVFRQVSEAIMARYIRPAISSLKDQTHTHLPFIATGNSEASLRVLDALGIATGSLWATTNYGKTWGQFSSKTDQWQFAPIANSTKGRMPNVIGMGAKDALWLLERQKLKVRLQGSGVVVAQSISAGSAYAVGDNITLHLGYQHTPPKITPTDSSVIPPKTPTTTPQKSASSTATPAPQKPQASTKPQNDQKPKTTPTALKSERSTPQTAKPKTAQPPKPQTKPQQSNKDNNKAKPKTITATPPKPSTKPNTSDKPTKAKPNTTAKTTTSKPPKR